MLKLTIISKRSTEIIQKLSCLWKSNLNMWNKMYYITYSEKVVVCRRLKKDENWTEYFKWMKKDFGGERWRRRRKGGEGIVLVGKVVLFLQGLMRLVAKWLPARGISPEWIQPNIRFANNNPIKTLPFTSPLQIIAY